MLYQWINQERTIISVTQDNGHVAIFEEGQPQWNELSAREDIAPYVEPEPLPPSPAQIEALRKAAYQDEADPLFFKWQRGESTEAAWLAKIAEIKARYPELS